MDENEQQKSGHEQPLSRLIPNFVTLMALISGVTSLQQAINGNFEGAVLMLLAAALFDILDGALARALKAQSEFGAQLDSLSDFLAFGIAPALRPRRQVPFECLLQTFAGPGENRAGEHFEQPVNEGALDRPMFRGVAGGSAQAFVMTEGTVKQRRDVFGIGERFGSQFLKHGQQSRVPGLLCDRRFCLR